MAIGPLSTVIPAKFHRHLSANILKSYLSCDHEYSRKLEKDVEPADIPIITKAFDEKVYTQVQNSLNELGQQFLMELHPWIINTLVDFDDLDQKICVKGNFSFKIFFYWYLLITDISPPGLSVTNLCIRGNDHLC